MPDDEITSDERYRAEAQPYLAHADSDKPHRCPNCWTGAAVYDSPGGRFQYWRAYTCPRCGQRYAKRPFLRWYRRPGEEPAGFWDGRFPVRWWWYDMVLRPVRGLRYSSEYYGWREGLRQEWRWSRTRRRLARWLRHG